MYTMKENVRDSIIAEMRPHLDAVLIDLLNQAIVRALFDVTVTESETLPATRDNTNEHILQLYMAKKAPKLSKKTVKYYLLTIKHFLEFSQKSLLEVSDLDVEFYLQEYGRKGNQASTINNERRNLSAFFTWMRKTHLITENPVDSVEPLKTIDKPIDYLEDWEMEALRDACKIEKTSKVTGIREYRECLRDRALLEFLRSTGARVGEIPQINREDLDWNTGDILILSEKSGKYRTLYVDEVARFHLKRYLDSRVDQEEALFVWEKKPFARLGKSGFRSALKSIARREEMECRVYPHKLRKTLGMNLKNRGADIGVIQEIMGHANPTVTSRYYAQSTPETLRGVRQRTAA